MLSLSCRCQRFRTFAVPTLPGYICSSSSNVVFSRRIGPSCDELCADLGTAYGRCFHQRCPRIISTRGVDLRADDGATQGCKYTASVLLCKTRAHRHSCAP